MPSQTRYLKPSASAIVPSSLHMLRFWPKANVMALLLRVLMVPVNSMRRQSRMHNQGLLQLGCLSAFP